MGRETSPAASSPICQCEPRGFRWRGGVRLSRRQHRRNRIYSSNNNGRAIGSPNKPACCPIGTQCTRISKHIDCACCTITELGLFANRTGISVHYSINRINNIITRSISIIGCKSVTSACRHQLPASSFLTTFDTGAIARCQSVLYIWHGSQLDEYRGVGKYCLHH